MKRNLQFQILFMSFIFFTMSSSANQPPIVAQSLSPQAKQLLKSLNFQTEDIEFPEVSRQPLQLESTLYYVKNLNNNPLQRMMFILPRGENSEDKKFAPANQLISQWLQQSGTKNLNYLEFQQMLYQNGGKLKISANYENWIFELNFLEESSTVVLDLFADLLIHPNLQDSTFKALKEKARIDIRERNTYPAKIARRVIREHLYPQTRYSYSYQAEDLERITIPLLKKIMKSQLNPRKMAILYTGRKVNSSLISHLNQILLKMNEKYPQQIPASKIERLQPKKAEGSIIFVKKDSAAQGVVALATGIPPFQDPRQIAFRLGNYTLGGASFTSRLSNTIRDKYGLAYYVYSYPSYLKNLGTWVAITGSKPGKLPLVLELCLAEIEQINRIKTEELELGKNALVNRMIFQYADVGSYLSQIQRLDSLQMPPDYLNSYSKKIRNASKSSVESSTADWLRKDKLHIVIVGPAKVARVLQKKYPVIIIDSNDSLTGAEKAQIKPYAQ